jgi:signal transduction histidine kinase
MKQNLAPGAALEALKGRRGAERRQAELDLRQFEVQLRHAQKMESIGTLAGGIAHDFNNILGSILGNATLLRQELGPDHPSLVSIDEIQRVGLRARELVRQILAFSRKQPQELRVQPLAPIVAGPTPSCARHCPPACRSRPRCRPLALRARRCDKFSKC